MQSDSPHHHRRSIRLPGYDYSQPAPYFITICTQNRKFLFGDIAGGIMRLNDAGRMVRQWYTELEYKFPSVQCDEFVCMPNHVHFIVVNVGINVGGVVQWFKTMTTNEYIRGVKQHGWPPFPGKLWQRNYWEHVIRNADELNRIRQYIRDNPANWDTDSMFVGNRDGKG